MQYKHQVIDPLSMFMDGMLTQAGFDLIKASAEFVDAHTVKAGDKTVTAENIVIATGQYDCKLDIPGKNSCIPAVKY